MRYERGARLAKPANLILCGLALAAVLCVVMQGTAYAAPSKGGKTGESDTVEVVGEDSTTTTKVAFTKPCITYWVKSDVGRSKASNGATAGPGKNALAISVRKPTLVRKKTKVTTTVTTYSDGTEKTTTAKRVTARKTLSYGIKLSVNVEGKGWIDAAWNGGKTVRKVAAGKGAIVQAVRITPSAALTKRGYCVYYRVKVKGKGWLGWAHDGLPAGSIACHAAIRKLQVQVVKKAPGATEDSFLNPAASMQETVRTADSSTKYLLAVDCSAHKVGVFVGKKRAWEPLYYWDCADGAPESPTPKGNYSIGTRGYSFSGALGGTPYTCYYWTGFIGSTYLFHSVEYHPGTWRVLDGRLGQAISHGCVRLAANNAKWIYRHIPSGTRVKIY